MRILHVLWTGQYGGIQKLVSDMLLFNKADQKNADLIIISHKEYLFDYLSGKGIKVFYCGLKSGYDFNFIKLYRLFLLFKEYDIIHMHDFNPFVALMSCLSGKKIIYTVHGGFNFFRRIRFSELINKRLLNIFFKTRVDFLVFNSEFTKSVAIKYHKLKKSNYAVIQNGINTETVVQTSPEPDENKNKSFIIGACGRFVEFKRFDLLIYAFYQFSKDKDAKLMMVGDGHLKHKYENIISDLGIRADQVIITGFTDKVSYYMKQMDVLVMPSINEPFGLVAVESLLHGNPTIVFRDGGGLVEIIEGIEPLDIVENIDDLVKRLNYYYSNQSEITDKAEKRKKYAERFNIKDMISKYQNIYGHL